MVAPRLLRDAPIHEALIDLRVRLPKDVDAEDLKQAHERLRENYPQLGARLRGQFELTFDADGSATQRATQKAIDGHLFKSADEKRIVQFRLDGFTYNWLRPYDRWEVFRDEARRLWRIYVDHAKPEVITRVAVRYINRLPLPAPVTEFGDFLTAPPRVPETLPQGVSSFLTRVVIHEPQKRFTGIITQALEGIVDPTIVPILLDIDASREADFAVDGQEAWEILEELRNFKNKIFFESITERTLGLFI